jgi:hypothetical protein
MQEQHVNAKQWLASAKVTEMMNGYKCIAWHGFVVDSVSGK